MNEKRDGQSNDQANSECLEQKNALAREQTEVPNSIGADFCRRKLFDFRFVFNRSKNFFNLWSCTARHYSSSFPILPKPTKNSPALAGPDARTRRSRSSNVVRL